MTMKLTKKLDIQLFVLTCFFVYLVSYLLRLNYGAVIVEVVSDLGIAKSAAGIVSTGSFITYGAGQLLAGYFGDRFSPRKIIFFGLLGSTLCNLIMPFCRVLPAMAAVWSLNGLAQSMMWPPLLRIFSDFLREKDFLKGLPQLSVAVGAGTIGIYLLAPVFIHLGGWRLVFLFGGAVGIAYLIVWELAIRHFERRLEPVEGERADVKQEEQRKGELLPILLAAGFIPMAVMIFLQGVLKDGIATWLPAYIGEVYRLSNEVSILSAVVLPVFHVFSTYLVSAVLRRMKNEVLVATIFFGASGLASLLLCLFYSANMVSSLLLSAVITGGVHGVNVMILSFLPHRFAAYGKIAGISGFFNFCTYVGSAVSTYAVAQIAERSGWQMTILSWAVIATVGTILCLVSLRMWNRKFRE